MRSTIIFFILLLLAVKGHTQQVLTLEQAIDLALKNNYDIRLARNDADVAANDYAYADFAVVPGMNGTAGRTGSRQAIKQEFVNGNQGDTSGIKSNNYAANVSL